MDDAIKHNSRKGVSIRRYVIMPNHMHMIVVLHPDAESRKTGDATVDTGDRGRSPLQEIVRNMKAYITEQIGYTPWQRSYHDRIIRNEEEYRRICRYIDQNPARWMDDEYFVQS